MSGLALFCCKIGTRNILDLSYSTASPDPSVPCVSSPLQHACPEKNTREEEEK